MTEELQEAEDEVLREARGHDFIVPGRDDGYIASEVLDCVDQLTGLDEFLQEFPMRIISPRCPQGLPRTGHVLIGSGGRIWGNLEAVAGTILRFPSRNGQLESNCLRLSVPISLSVAVCSSLFVNAKS